MTMDRYDCQCTIDIMGKFKKEQWDNLCGESVARMHKASDLITIGNDLVSFVKVLNAKLIPTWKAMDKFATYSSSDDPIGSDGKPRSQQLTRLVESASKITEELINSQLYSKITTNNETYDRTAGSLLELGYNPTNLKECWKLIGTLLVDSKQNGWNYSYISAEDHSTGHNFVAYHVFDYYARFGNDPYYRCIEDGDGIFFDTTKALKLCMRELTKIVKHTMRTTGYKIIDV